MNHTLSPRPTTTHTSRDLDEWANDLERIRAVAHRRRLLGHPDVPLELGCAVLECRLADMRKEVDA